VALHCRHQFGVSLKAAAGRNQTGRFADMRKPKPRKTQTLRRDEITRVLPPCPVCGGALLVKLAAPKSYLVCSQCKKVIGEEI